MKPWQKLKFASTLVIAGLLLRPAPLLACAACYGQSDSPLAQGMNWGIFSLLALVVCVLSGIATFFVHIGRKSANAVRAAEAGKTPTPEA